MFYWNCCIYLPILVFVSCIFDSSTLRNKNTPCTPVGPCKCEFPNGYGVDLSVLKLNISSDALPGTGSSVLFSPCHDYPVGSGANLSALNECVQGVTLCLVTKVNATYNTYKNLGKVGEGTFVWGRFSDVPTIVYKHNNMTTNIQLSCGMEDRMVTLQYQSGSASIYNLVLDSPDVCANSVEPPEGRSVFSLLLFMSLVLFLFYFVGGFLVLRFIRGATGWEAIPNSEFWKSTYMAMKGTLLYFFGGCRRPETYDTI